MQKYEMIYLFLFYAYNRSIVLDEETVFQLKFNLWLLLNCSIAIFLFLWNEDVFNCGYHPDARIYAASPAGGFFIKHGLKVVVLHTLGERTHICMIKRGNRR